MNDYFGLVQLNIVIPRAGNLDQWQTIRAEYDQFYHKVANLLFTQGVVKEAVYLESHQLTINILGAFTPENESDLIIQYDNSPAYYQNEIPRLVAQALAGYTYSLELGTMKFTVL